MSRARAVVTVLRTLWLGLWLAVSISGAALAQLSSEQQDFVAKWTATAQRAEQAIDTGKASNAAFEGLREEIVNYRRTFEDARRQNSARIDTLQSQLTALGPAPAEGETESADIAALRDELNTRIEKLRVPVVISQKAYSRADGLIGEIDRIIRERQTRRLLSRKATPLDPYLWPLALGDLIRGAQDLSNETRTSLSNLIERRQLRENLPQVVLLVLAGLLFLIRGRSWSVRIGNYFRRFGGRGFGVWGFVISLGRIGFPLAGVYLFSKALAVSQILGLRGDLILESVPFWAATLLGFRWLGDRMYPQRDEDLIIPLYPETRVAARRNLLLMGLTIVLQDMVVLFEQIENISDGVRAVVGLPVILLGALSLLRLRQILRNEDIRRGLENDQPVERSGLLVLGPMVRRLSGGVAIAAPLLAIAGYGALAEALIYPFLLSIGLFGLLLVLQNLFGDLYAWLSGKGPAASDSVVPVLNSFMLAVVSLPVLALIWGARVTDLTELWDRFLRGVKVGDTQISPANFATFAVVFVIGYTLTRLLQGALATNLLPKTRLDKGGQMAVVAGVKYLGVFLSAVIAVSMAGIDLSSLAIVAGALSVGIGFGLQNIVSNFVSGIILLVERPVSEGDWIEVGGNMGYVRDISVRSTRIETFDRTDVIVPNSDLVSGTVTNYTRGKTIGRVIVPVGVAYGTDTRQVETILREIAEAQPMVLSNPGVVFREFGADSLNFEIRAILRDVNFSLSVRSDINHEINRRFAEAGIEIPFAQRDVWLRNPEVLNGGQATLADPAQPAGAVRQAADERPAATRDAPETGPDDDP
jgi:potassium-dependent mechanosensitive channel